MGILPLLQPPRIGVGEDDQPYYPALRESLNVLFAFYGKTHMLNLGMISKFATVSLSSLFIIVIKFELKNV